MTNEPLPLRFRCDEDWDAMDRDGRDRHCGRCDRRVVDLSARTALGARWALATRRAPCIRYAVRSGRSPP